jgi:hypothetical protein
MVVSRASVFAGLYHMATGLPPPFEFLLLARISTSGEPI